MRSMLLSFLWHARKNWGLGKLNGWWNSSFFFFLACSFLLKYNWKDWCWSGNSNTLATWCIWKDPAAGKDWGQEEKGTTEDEMVGWHHWLNGHGFGWTLGVCDGQWGLVCCGSWGHKELDMTERLNWTDYISITCFFDDCHFCVICLAFYF